MLQRLEPLGCALDLQQRARFGMRLWVLGIVLLLGAVPLMSIDMASARLARDADLPGDVERLIKLSEFFAHGSGVVIILILIATLDPRGLVRVPRIATAAFGAGLIAQLAKHIIARTRPLAMELDDGVMRTFGGWLPRFTDDAARSTSAIQSMPSGHTATTVGLCVGLLVCYPRGRWLFPCLAVLAASQRWFSSAHYLSDIAVGAGIGCVFGAWSVVPFGLGRRLDRLEHRLARKFQSD